MKSLSPIITQHQRTEKF